MALSIDDAAARWRANPDVAGTLALCEALRDAPQAALVDEVGHVAVTRHAHDAGVLTAAARMYLAGGRLNDAQTALVAAGKIAPRDALVYRWLGEVLLRRGDADRAVKVLERALQLGATDGETRLWAERARVFKPIQATAGMRAVAGEIARTAPPTRGRSDLVVDGADTGDTSTTEVLVVKAPALGRPDDDDLPPPLRPQARPPVTSSLPPRLSPVGQSASPSGRPASAVSPSGRPYPPASPMSTGTNAAVRFDDESVTRKLDRASLDDEPDPLTARYERSAPPPRAAVTDEPFKPTGFTPPPRAPSASPPRNGASARPAPAEPPPPRDPAPAPARPPSKTPPRASDVIATGVPLALDPRDVLGALELAGVYEPTAAGPAAPIAWDPAEKRKSRGSVPLVAALVLFLGAGIGLVSFIRTQRAKQHAEAEALLGQVETTVHASRMSDLSGAETTLGRAFDLDSRSPRAALLWLRERALVGLLKGGSEIAFEESITRAKEVGVADADVAFARVASFLFQGDTAGAAGVLPRWDGAAANDAWYQLLAGATLERAGDPRALERYEAATRLDPELVAAQIAQVRAMAFDRDPTQAAEMARALKAKLGDRAEGPALVTLAWGRDPARSEVAPAEVGETIQRAAELPVSLAAIPHAAAALLALDKRDAASAKVDVQKGLAVALGPGTATWLGDIALDTGDEQLARKAALTAVSFSAVYPPARVLAARVALLGDRLDEALKATEELDANAPEVAVVRAAAAYERIDADGVARAIDAVPEAARKVPFLNALLMAPDVLAGHPALPGDKLLALADDDAPWSDLVAMDSALDAGELETADAIAALWRGTEAQPLHALRLARLARYEGKLEAADAQSQTALASGTVTPRSLAERVMLLVARGKGNEAAPLLAKYPLVLGPMGTWLGAYALASTGKVDEARGKTASLDPPPVLAPLPTRVFAAAALGAMKDKKRAVDVLKPMLAAGMKNPDVAAAALAVGFKRVERGKKVTFVGP